MPRNGSGVYGLPATYEATAGETILAEQHNDPLEDLEQDANTPRPIVAGGTGVDTAVEAHDVFSTKGSNIASATTTNLATATGQYVHITGTTTITALGTATAGIVRRVVFDAALTLTHNATSLILPGGANITTAAGDAAEFVSEGGGNWKCVDYQMANGQLGDAVRYSAQTLTPAQQSAARANVSAALRGHIFGLTCSNNGTDATNDLDIAAGEAASTETDPVLIVLASAITKQIDATWAVGTNAGGLDTGTVTNAFYHVWLIRRSDTGVVDVLFSLSATSPTMPANYDQKRRIMTIPRLGGTIKPFTQQGDDVLYTTPTADYNTTIGTSRTTISLSVPGNTVAKIRALATLSSAIPGVWIGPLTETDAAVTSTTTGIILRSSANDQSSVGQFEVQTNANSSGQIAARSNTASTTLQIVTYGFRDLRGRMF